MRSSRVEERYCWPRRNFAALLTDRTDYATSRVVVVPIPYDGTVTANVSGTREGPSAIINASQDLEPLEPAPGRDPAAAGIHTLPEVAPVFSSPEDMTATVAAVARDLLADDKRIVTLGGEHSLTVGLVRAHLERYPHLGVLSVDAHADLQDEYLGTRYSHACVSRRLLETAPLMQVGVRSAGREEAEMVRARRSAGRLLTADELHDDPAWIDRVLAALPDEVYLSIDLDGLDPSIMAAVDLAEPGGLTWRQVVSLGIAVGTHRRLVGFDVVELSPREGPRACAFLAAKLTYLLMGYLAT